MPDCFFKPVGGVEREKGSGTILAKMSLLELWSPLACFLPEFAKNEYLNLFDVFRKHFPMLLGSL